MAENNRWVLETTAERFEQDVIEQSRERLVLVDCWAPWCEPCRQLTPILEKLAAEFGGRFALVKVDIDRLPHVAQALRVQSIPFVAAVRDGQFADHFMGLMPEAELRQWLAPLLPSPADEAFARGQALENDDPAAAEAEYRRAVELEPEKAPAQIALARVLLAQGKDDESRHWIERLEARGWLEPEAEPIKSQLELRAAAAEAGGVQEARRAAEADPENAELQVRLADALAVAGKHVEAMEICLALIRRDRAQHGEAARETMLKIFDAIGPQSPLVSDYRRRLATALY
ncbi:MAG: tetratricopeptide repeat protein [Planctomycetes bacterium]|nr:tetratricopeptide repeat protein [Planctomycetota bacterium]